MFDDSLLYIEQSAQEKKDSQRKRGDKKNKHHNLPAIGQDISDYIY